jgi:hypothetical protein
MDVALRQLQQFDVFLVFSGAEQGLGSGLAL